MPSPGDHLRPGTTIVWTLKVDFAVSMPFAGKHLMRPVFVNCERQFEATLSQCPPRANT